PRYIPDNQSLFIIGGMWMGLADGAATGVVVQQVVTAGGTRQDPCPGPGPCRGTPGDQLPAGFIGSAPGLALGAAGGRLLRGTAPAYGRVAIIQSAALGGALSGALMQLALQWKPYGAGWAYTVRPPPTQGFTPPAGSNITCAVNYAGLQSCAYQERSVL